VTSRCVVDRILVDVLFRDFDVITDVTDDVSRGDDESVNGYTTIIYWPWY